MQPSILEYLIVNVGVNPVPVQRNSFKVGPAAVNSQFLLCSGIHGRSKPAILRCLFRLCFCFLASGQKYGSRHSRRKQQRTLFFIVQFLLFIANLRISSTILLMATGLSTMNSPRKTPVFPLFLSALELLLLTAKNRAASSSRMLTKLFIWQKKTTDADVQLKWPPKVRQYFEVKIA